MAILKMTAVCDAKLIDLMSSLELMDMFDLEETIDSLG